MEKNGQVRYYIGKKQYVPDISDLLCTTSSDSFGNNATFRLYRIAKGSFFLVSESPSTATNVQIMDEKQAFDFMDGHTANIDTETYDRVFGTPEPG